MSSRRPASGDAARAEREALRLAPARQVNEMLSTHLIEGIRESLGRQSEPVLSVYLGVEQALQANRNREFESKCKTLVRNVARDLAEDSGAQEALERNAALVEAFLSEYKPTAKTLVVFSEAESGFFWSRGFQTAMRDRARWQQGPLLRPLLEALEEHEQYGVVLADRQRARIFRWFMGELAEEEGVFEASARRFKTVGTDHWRSQANFGRYAVEHEWSHYSDAVAALLRADRSDPFDRLVVAGPAAKHVAEELPKRLRRKLVGLAQLPVTADEAVIGRTLEEINEKAEREEEAETVEALITAAAKRKGAVVGLGPSAEALAQGRVSRLVYDVAFHADTAVCVRCGALASTNGAACEACGEPLTPAESALDAMVDRLEDTGGAIDSVRGPAADRLSQQGHQIGAFLRY